MVPPAEKHWAQAHLGGCYWRLAEPSAQMVNWILRKGDTSRRCNLRSESLCLCLCPRVLSGERPYWWVHETRFYGAGPVPPLQQFPITCETGPGTVPSTPALKRIVFLSLSLESLCLEQAGYRNNLL